MIPRATDDPDATVRAYAFDAVARWSGERFGAEWSGVDSERPTLAEGRVLRVKASAWWQAHREGFVPASAQ